MDEKTKQILGVLFICAVVVLFIAFAATTGLSRTTLNGIYPEETNNFEQHAVFSHNGEDIVTISVRAMPGTYSDNSTIPLMVVLTHPEHTNIDSLKMSIHPPQTTTEFPYGDIYLKIPEWNPGPTISFRTETESGREISVMDIPDMGVQGKGSLRFDFLIHPFRESGQEEFMDVYLYAQLSGTSDFWNKYVVSCPVGVEFT